MTIDAISQLGVRPVGAARPREAGARGSAPIRATHSAAYHAEPSDEADPDEPPASGSDLAVHGEAPPAEEVEAGADFLASASPPPASRLIATLAAAEEAYASN